MQNIIKQIREAREKATDLGNGYAVTPDGDVLSLSDRFGRVRILKQQVHTTGYKVVYFTINGKRKRFNVHKLICSTYHGEKPSSTSQIRHLNGNKLDNRASNLCWGTARENAFDRGRHGTCKAKENGRNSAKKVSKTMKRLYKNGDIEVPIGSERINAKLNEDKVRAIKELRNHGEKWKDIAERFNVSTTTAREACLGKTWSHV